MSREQLADELQKNNEAVIKALAEHNSAAKQSSNPKTGLAKRLKERTTAARAGSAKLKAARTSSVKDSGMVTNLDNGDALVAFLISLGALWNPANEALLPANLQAFIAEGRNLLFNVQDKKQSWKLDITRRKDVYKNLKPLARQVVSELIACGAPKSTVKHGEHWRDLINGQRIINISAEVTDEIRISACHTSFGQQVTNLNGLINVVATAPEYASNVEALTVVGLENRRDAMMECNHDANSTSAYWRTAMTARNRFFNEEYTGFVDIFSAAKRAVKATFGNSSPEYKQISRLSFNKIR